MKCGGTTQAGEPCQAPERFVDPESGFCPSHDPSKSEFMREAAAKGGEATGRKHKRPPFEERDVPPPPQSVADARDWLSWVAVNLARGVLSEKEARSLSYTLRAYLDAVERADVADEIEELREKLQALQEGKLESIEEVA